MIIESHAHYSHYKFNQTFRYLSYKNGNFSLEEGNRYDLIENLKENGVVASVEPAIGIESNEKLHQLSNFYPDFIFPSYGCHPTRAYLAKWRDRKIIEGYALLSSGKCVAIGETGLDYHYERKNQHRLCQKRWFRYQIKLAYKLNKPLILHIRKASSDALKMLKKYRKYLTGGVVHCFCDDYKVAQAYIDLGLHIGIGGALLQNENSEMLSEVVRGIPLERIVVETDAPYVLPDIADLEMGKKKNRIRNTSMILSCIIERIAEIKGLSVPIIENTVLNNTIKLFSLRSASAFIDRYSEEVDMN